MAITYPLTPPSALKSARIEWFPKSVVGVAPSIFTGQQQVYAHQGQWWEVSLSTPRLSKADAGAVSAFLCALNGREGTFYLGDRVRTTTQGSAAGSWVVDTGATIRSTTLPLTGGTGAFAAGDWLQIGGHNYCLQSESYGTSPWVVSEGTIGADAVANPVNGATTADKLQETNTAGVAHEFKQTLTIAAGVITYSEYFKAAERSKVQLNFYNATDGTPAAAVFDLSAGTVVTVFYGTAAILSVGGGWYRCSITGTATATNTTILRYTYADAAIYTGTTGYGVYGFGAQAEVRDTAGAYQATTTAAVSTELSLYHVTQINRTGTDMTSVDVFPRLRVAHASGAPITYNGARGIFRLQVAPSFAINLGSVYDPITLSAIEVIPTT